MKRLKPYLMFSGNCGEALHFYKECLNGEIVFMHTFAESPVNVPDEHKQKIFNSEFRVDDVHFMASDSIPPYEITIGNNFALFINFSDFDELEKIYAKLSNGGNVIMPLENKFGMLVDKFGIQWMLNGRAD